MLFTWSIKGLRREERKNLPTGNRGIRKLVVGGSSLLKRLGK